MFSFAFKLLSVLFRWYIYIKLYNSINVFIISLFSLDMSKLSLIILLNFSTFLDALCVSSAKYFLSISLVFLSSSAIAFNLFNTSSAEVYFLSLSYFLIFSKRSLDSSITFLSELLKSFGFFYHSHYYCHYYCHYYYRYYCRYYDHYHLHYFHYHLHYL